MARGKGGLLGGDRQRGARGMGTLAKASITKKN